MTDADGDVKVDPSPPVDDNSGSDEGTGSGDEAAGAAGAVDTGDAAGGVAGGAEQPSGHPIKRVRSTGGRNRKSQKPRVKKEKKPKVQNWDLGASADGAAGQPQRVRAPPKILESEAFDAYYKAQGIIPEAEWDLFKATLRRPLPASFRVSMLSPVRDRLVAELAERFQFGGKEFEIEGQTYHGPRELEWYPGGVAWQTSCPRNMLRNSPELKQLHRWLVHHSDCGDVWRQEAVSMIPPLLLEIEPEHMVLDMCAAPGSKTSQMVEMLHERMTSDEMPTGLIVANELNSKRAYMLVHQIQKLGSPNFLATTHDARTMPYMRPADPKYINSESAGLGPDAVINNYKYAMPRDAKLFDRILCDVPCSGDGTMRKSPHVWPIWSVSGGHDLHIIQLQIALQALSLLRIGGRLVYSTCALNPIENEAVVAEILRRTHGAVRIVDCSSKLPKLKRRPGLATWKVCDKKGVWYDSFAAAEAASNVKGKIFDSMFPPNPTTEAHIAAQLPFCWRLAPHDQDTGGFFITLFEKTGTYSRSVFELRQPKEDVPAGAAAGAAGASGAADGTAAAQPAAIDAPVVRVADDVDAADESKTQAEGYGGVEVNEDAPSAPAAEAKKTGFKADARTYNYNPLSAESWTSIQKDYGLTDAPRGNLFVANQGVENLVFYLTPLAASILSGPKAARLKLVQTGQKMFGKMRKWETAIEYRVCNDGGHLALPHMALRKVPCTEQDFITVLSAPKAVPFSALSPETAAGLEALSVGPALLYLPVPPANFSSATPLARFAQKRAQVMAILRGPHNSVTPQVGKDDKVAMLTWLNALPAVADSGAAVATTTDPAADDAAE